MSKQNYLHHSKSMNLVNGKKVINEEGIYKGTKGLTMKHYLKDGEDIEKMVVVKRDGKYIIKMIKNGEKKEYEYNDDELFNLLRTNNKFNFIINFLKQGIEDITEEKTDKKNKDKNKKDKEKRKTKDKSRDKSRDKSKDKSKRRSKKETCCKR